MLISKVKQLLLLALVSGTIFVIGLHLWLNPDWREHYRITPTNEESTEIHLLTNYPLMTEKPWNENQTDTNTSRLWQRQLELEKAIQRNLNHAIV